MSDPAKALARWYWKWVPPHGECCEAHHCRDCDEAIKDLVRLVTTLLEVTR